MTDPSQPPGHLSDEAADWWRAVVSNYQLEPHHLKLLRAACEALDRMGQARRELADHGPLTFVDAKGMLRAHPAVAIERDARIAYARLLRELDLDCGGPAESRPPALISNRRN